MTGLAKVYPANIDLCPSLRIAFHTSIEERQACSNPVNLITLSSYERNFTLTFAGRGGKAGSRATGEPFAFGKLHRTR